MASYNAGRSLSHMLTENSFDKLDSAKTGFVKVGEAVETIFGHVSSDPSMKEFIIEMFGAFAKSKPGFLSRSEYLQLYSCFLKRPQVFSEFMMRGVKEEMVEEETKEEEVSADASSSSSKQRAAAAAAAASKPKISDEQLKQMVENVNAQLAAGNFNQSPTSSRHKMMMMMAGNTDQLLTQSSNSGNCDSEQSNHNCDDDLNLD